jgi:tRNA pseudouridine32 synthase/23S rRNA pseudouridine746 synthase
VEPITGRAHQIRLHFKEIGHPILGDDLYAPQEVMQRADRLLLHAASLTVTHPGTGKRETFCSVCPF